MFITALVLVFIIKSRFPKGTPIFNILFRINNMFRFKDTVPVPLRSSLVYKYVCNRCKSVYIGKTSRHLSTRISEPLEISYRTAVPLTNPPLSAIKIIQVLITIIM